MEEALSGVKGANSVKLFGNDMATLEEAGQRVVNILKSIPGIENVGLFHIVGQPNLEIEIDRAACARHGINVSDVEKAVQVAVGGQAFSQMVEGEKLYDIVLRLPPKLRMDPQVIRRVMVEVPARDNNSSGYRLPALGPGPDLRLTSPGRLTFTARTTAATFPSSSACAGATSPRPSARRSKRSKTPRRRPATPRLPPRGRVNSPRCNRPMTSCSGSYRFPSA